MRSIFDGNWITDNNDLSIFWVKKYTNKEEQETNISHRHQIIITQTLNIFISFFFGIEISLSTT